MFPSPTTPQECPICIGRRVLEDVIIKLESIPIIHEEERYDHAIEYVLDCIDDAVDVWRCRHMETN